MIRQYRMAHLYHLFMQTYFLERFLLSFENIIYDVILHINKLYIQNKFSDLAIAFNKNYFNYNIKKTFKSQTFNAKVISHIGNSLFFFFKENKILFLKINH